MCINHLLCDLNHSIIYFHTLNVQNLIICVALLELLWTMTWTILKAKGLVEIGVLNGGDHWIKKGVIIWLHRKGGVLGKTPLYLKCRAKCWFILDYLFLKFNENKILDWWKLTEQNGLRYQTGFGSFLL